MRSFIYRDKFMFCNFIFMLVTWWIIAFSKAGSQYSRTMVDLIIFLSTSLSNLLILPLINQSGQFFIFLLTSLGNLLIQPLIDEGNQLLKFEDLYEEMLDGRNFLKSHLKDIEKVKRRNETESLKRVKRKLIDLLYDADDIIADRQLPLPENSSFFSTVNSRRKIANRLKAFKEDKEKVEKEIASLGPAPNPPIQQQISINSQSSYEADSLVGLKEETKKIKAWALNAKGSLTVIGIVGMSGIGKTTLANQICNSKAIKFHFKRTIVVQVSQGVKMGVLTKKRLRKSEVKEEKMRIKDDTELLTLLKSKLNKRCLVILDDVSDEAICWGGTLKFSLPSKSGSCVIVTTSNEAVARSMGADEKHIHHHTVLSDEDSWTLFCKIAFPQNKGKCTDRQLEGFGKTIVSSCGGLPLAIKSMGEMMSANGDSVNDWKKFAENIEEVKDKDKQVISKIEENYERLPSHLKTCLLCFAVLPEGTEIKISPMVSWWIAEGIVPESNGRTLYECGEAYFEELVSRSFILGVRIESFERRFGSFRMHAKTRDTVIRIARDEDFIGLDDRGSLMIRAESRRAGILRINKESFKTNSKLRALIGIELNYRAFPGKELCHLKWLRALSLSFADTEINNPHKMGWLSGIVSMPHLIYLNIEKIGLTKLPNSIGLLHNLQIFSLSDCPNLEKLPKEITYLKKLTSLQLTSCDSLQCMPKGIGELANLQCLIGFKPAVQKSDGCDVSELKNLTQLRQLSLKLSSADQIDNDELDVLSRLEQLHYLEISFAGFFGSIGLLTFSPPLRLQELHLYDFPGEEMPTWLNPISLPNLRILRITRGNLTHFDTDAGKWKLDSLLLESLDELTVKWKELKEVMPSLKLMKIRRCPKLQLFPCDVETEGTWRKEDHAWDFFPFNLLSRSASSLINM